MGEEEGDVPCSKGKVYETWFRDVYVERSAKGKEWIRLIDHIGIWIP